MPHRSGAKTGSFAARRHPMSPIAENGILASQPPSGESARTLRGGLAWSAGRRARRRRRLLQPRPRRQSLPRPRLLWSMSSFVPRQRLPILPSETRAALRASTAARARGFLYRRRGSAGPSTHQGRVLRCARLKVNRVHIFQFCHLHLRIGARRRRLALFRELQTSHGNGNSTIHAQLARSALLDAAVGAREATCQIWTASTTRRRKRQRSEASPTPK